jgi:peptidoglycan/xylan/chitin deacetylase (PgdA/CDA1 family)
VAQPVTRGGTPAVALTFDDGPHPEHTPRLLDRLAEHGIAATFFAVGTRARRHPALIRRIVDDGHALGNHSLTHSGPDRLSGRQFLQEVRSARAILQDISGRACDLVRPPRGKVTARTLWGLWSEGQTVVLWNVDPCDYRIRSGSGLNLWCDGYRPQNGDILLLHDNRPFAAPSMERFAEMRSAGGARFVRVSDWVAQKPLDSVVCRTRREETVPCP